MRDRFFQRTFNILLLARDAWIIAAIVVVALIFIRQGQQILAKVALEPEYWWSILGTTFWSLSAYCFTRLRYKQLLESHNRDAITQSQATAMTMVAGLIPIVIILIGMHVALPTGLSGIEHIVVPLLSLAAFSIILAVPRIVSTLGMPLPTDGRFVRASDAILIAAFILPWFVFFILGFFAPIDTTRVVQSYPLITLWAGAAIAIMGCLQLLSERVGLPVTGILIAGAFIFSAVVPGWHDGHRIRTFDSSLDPDQRATLHDAVELWQESQPADEPLTITLVAAPSGGVVSALWTSVSLAKLRESYGEAFAQSIFAISAVSGGSLGATLYVEASRPQAKGCLFTPSGQRDSNDLPLSKLDLAVADFASVDHTAAAAMRLIYLNDALSPYVGIGPYNDRSEVLETSWELAWHEATDNQDCSSRSDPALADSYLARWYDSDDGKTSLSRPHGRVSRFFCSTARPWPVAGVWC